jgi:glutamine amidotransferase
VAEIVIVDYGAGNVRSMHNALEHVACPGQRVTLTADPELIRKAERLVLPGVGAFGECWRKMEQQGVLEPLREAVDRGVPFLGVCVGMQVLADRGEEFGEHPGLGWIHGVTRQIPLPAELGLKLPHIGWAPLERAPHALWDGIPDDAYFYFVHSFFLDSATPSDVVARVTYGIPFTAAVAHENVFGCQFHPEKSDRPGLQLLGNFCGWSP